jgi:hypothetical protein
MARRVGVLLVNSKSQKAPDSFGPKREIMNT